MPVVCPLRKSRVRQFGGTGLFHQVLIATLLRWSAANRREERHVVQRAALALTPDPGSAEPRARVHATYSTCTRERRERGTDGMEMLGLGGGNLTGVTLLEHSHNESR